MANLSNFNFNKLDLRLSNSEYYDFWLGVDEDYQTNFDCLISGSCLVSHFDFNELGTISGSDISRIYSIKTWDDAVNTGVTATTYGFTGIDNGDILFDFVSGDTANLALVNTITGSTLTIPSGDTRFIMHQVSGMTGDFIYPLSLVNDVTPLGNYIDFAGGFYQGYYKLDGYGYDVLPNRVEKGLMFDFWLKKDDLVTSGNTGTTLNDLYPENKGIFFYWGTRAENKFWNQFEGLNTGSTSGCTSGATEFCTIPKEIDIELVDEEGHILPLNPPLIEYKEYNNAFLVYGRASGSSCHRCGSTGDTVNNINYGFGRMTACEVTGDTPTITISGYASTEVNTTNGFLRYGRSQGSRCNCSRPSDGYGREMASCSTGSTELVTELDVNSDIVDNALAFIIKDDGSIGYRLLTYTSTCVNEVTVTGVTIKEEYSLSGMVTDGQWEHISVKWVANSSYDECDLKYGKPRNGRLMFYVNCRLKFIVENFPEFIARRLEEYKEKQLGVPFNMSLGGGSQGLLESMTFDGQDISDLGLNIERNFAGSFYGSISQFKIYQCDINWCALKTLCNTNRYD